MTRQQATPRPVRLPVGFQARSAGARQPMARPATPARDRMHAAAGGCGPVAAAFLGFGVIYGSWLGWPYLAAWLAGGVR